MVRDTQPAQNAYEELDVNGLVDGRVSDAPDRVPCTGALPATRLFIPFAFLDLH